MIQSVTGHNKLLVCFFSCVWGWFQLWFFLHGLFMFPPNARPRCCVKTWPMCVTFPGCVSLSWCLQGHAADAPWPWSGNKRRLTENGAITRGGATWLFDNFVNFSPPFNILSGRLKAARSLCHYLQQPVAYCNSSLQSWEDVFEFIIAAESASNLRLERRSVHAGNVCAHPQ